jgi:hypothetical protein
VCLDRFVASVEPALASLPPRALHRRPEPPLGVSYPFFKARAAGKGVRFHTAPQGSEGAAADEASEVISRQRVLTPPPLPLSALATRAGPPPATASRTASRVPQLFLPPPPPLSRPLEPAAIAPGHAKRRASVGAPTAAEGAGSIGLSEAEWAEEERRSELVASLVAGGDDGLGEEGDLAPRAVKRRGILFFSRDSPHPRRPFSSPLR